MLHEILKVIEFLKLLKNSRADIFFGIFQVGIVLSAQALDLSKSPYEIFKEAPLAHAFADTVPDGLSLVTSGAVPVKTHKDNQVCQVEQLFVNKIFKKRIHSLLKGRAEQNRA